MANSTEEAKKPSLRVGQKGSSQDPYAFRFVEVGGPSRSWDEDARSVIRSHVMRDFYEKRDHRRQPSTFPENTSVASKKEGAVQQTHRFKVGPQGLQEIKKRRRKIDNVSQKLEAAPLVATKAYGPVQNPAQKPSDPSTCRSIRPDAAPLPSFEHCNDQTVGTATGDLVCSSTAPDFVGDESHQPSQSDHDIQIALRPEFLPTGSGIDPFNTLPQSRSPRTQVLLYHANRSVLSSRVMGQLRTEWLSLATQDAALFHVALSHYAGNYGLVHQESDPVEALRFRMESMRLVNERLGDTKSALADGTLGTVASLSSYEATNGSLTAINTHMKGLQHLVKLRGGLQDGMNPYTRRLILWADLNCANALGSDPIFNVDVDGNPRPSPSYTGASEEEGYRTSVASLQSVALGARDLEGLSHELKDSFTRLKHLAGLDADDIGHAKSRKEDNIGNSDRLYLTERSLLVLSNIWGPGKFATSGCIAATIFLDNYLRGIGFNARLMDRFVSRLQFSMNMVLNDISRHKANEKTARAILWVLYVGGTAAGGRPEREWFIAQLLDFCDGLGLKTFEEAEIVLKDFLWAPTWQNQGRLLWMQVEEMRLLKNIVWPDFDDLTNTGSGKG